MVTVRDGKEAVVSSSNSVSNGRADAAPDYIDELRQRYINGNPEMEARLGEARVRLQLGQEAYDLRTQAGLSKEQLAEDLGVSAEFVSSFENGAGGGNPDDYLAQLREIVGKHGSGAK